MVILPHSRTLQKASLLFGTTKNRNRKTCSGLVRCKGFEPLTFWFVAKHSIQLSYWRIPQFRLPIYNIIAAAKSQQFFS